MFGKLGLAVAPIWLIAACTAPVEKPLEPAKTVKVSVSAYCLRGKSASGPAARAGMAAADPDVFPLGSVIRLRQLGGETAARERIYTILDTGSKVRGRHIDLYFSSCREAIRFGRRTMIAEILRLGWAPDTAQPLVPPKRDVANRR